MMGRMGAAILELLFPSRALCLGCGTLSGCREAWICEECLRKLAAGWVGPFPDKQLLGSAAAYWYAGPAGGVVRALKYHQAFSVAPIMARDMVRAWESVDVGAAEAIVPVPMHPKRLRKRGIDHTAILAEALSRELGIPWEALLKRTRNTPQQARLTEKERKTNLQGAFSADAAAKGRHLLLIDDVYTSGETAHACAKALRRAGARSVSFLCYAKG